MNSKPVTALEAVADDLDAAARHYESWRSDGAIHFLDLYEETIRWIAWSPDLFPRRFGRVQRAVIKHSYFVIYFVQETSRTLVIAVLDGRRDPADLRRIARRRRLKASPSTPGRAPTPRPPSPPTP